MGASSSIRIYSVRKLHEKFDEEVIDSFLEHFSSGSMSIHYLNNETYLTRYSSSDYCSDDLYDVVKQKYRSDLNKFDPTKNYVCNMYDVDYFMKLDEDVRRTFSDIINYLENECYLNSWEVWT